MYVRAFLLHLCCVVLQIHTLILSQMCDSIVLLYSYNLLQYYLIKLRYFQLHVTIVDGVLAHDMIHNMSCPTEPEWQDRSILD